MLIKPKGSPLLHFSVLCDIFRKKKFSKIPSFFKKNVLRFLSLRYSADFRRSRLVIDCDKNHCPHLRTKSLSRLIINKTPAEERDIFRPELFYNYIFVIIVIFKKNFKNLYKYISHEAKFMWVEFYG